MIASLNQVVDTIAGRRTTTRAAVAMGWVLSGGRNVVAIPGAKSPEQVKTLRDVIDLRLDPADIDELNTISAQCAFFA